MRIFRGFDNLPHFNRAVATMGSFDGLHRGHLELIRRVCNIATEKGGESIVLTFEPHPRYVLGTGEGLYLLSSLEEKAYLLEQAGIDNLIVIPFTIEFSKTSPEDFIKQNIAAIGVETLVVGYNHRFGHNKQGDYNFLESHGGKLEIYMVEQQQMQQSKVSSTVIRQTISSGDMAKATKLLSHPYIIIGMVNGEGVNGNIAQEKLLPPARTYYARIDGKFAELKVSEVRVVKICDWDKFCKVGTEVSGKVSVKVLIEINDVKDL